MEERAESPFEAKVYQIEPKPVTNELHRSTIRLDDKCTPFEGEIERMGKQVKANINLKPHLKVAEGSIGSVTRIAQLPAMVKKFTFINV